MTFTELVTDVTDELNLTSTNATTRVGRNVNKGYREIASSLGLQPVERREVTASTVTDSAYITFGPRVMKLERVWNPAFTPWQMLGESTVDEIRSSFQGTDPAQRYAVYNITSDTVTLLLDAVASSVYTLNADAMVNLLTLSGNMAPAFPEDFHDVLTYRPKAFELRKLEKYDEAQVQEAMYEKRLGELRFYIAKSGWLQLYQNKMGPGAVVTTTIPMA